MKKLTSQELYTHYEALGKLPTDPTKLEEAKAFFDFIVTPPVKTNTFQLPTGETMVTMENSFYPDCHAFTLTRKHNQGTVLYTKYKTIYDATDYYLSIRPMA